MLVYDVNNDGKSDILVGEAHAHGLYWWENQGEQNGTIAFEKHLIDEKTSQLHALHLADLNADGEPELITGKRYFAHNGGDKGAREPIEIVYYSIDRKTGTFSRHLIHQGREELACRFEPPTLMVTVLLILQWPANLELISCLTKARGNSLHLSLIPKRTNHACKNIHTGLHRHHSNQHRLLYSRQK